MTRILFAFLLIFAVHHPCVSAQEYFQQNVDYTIHVALDDERHELRGDIEMVYTNHSPDALPFIWMHLWPNAYSSAKTALAKQQFREGKMLLFYALDRVKGGIDSLDFKVNGLTAGWSYHPEHVDIAKIDLDEPLMPGASITISTPFRVAIPNGSVSRLGHIGQSYQITQWYPKPAVYDKDGWHEMPYLNQGEFYSEYGSFDVNITLPENYVIGATGDLVDGQKEIAFLDSIADATEAVIGSYTERVKNPDFPPSSSRTKTLRFKQENVHDFAWFADKRWMVLRGDVTLENGHNVDTWAMFTPQNAHLWARGVEYINDAVAHYSKYVGNYPYNHCTAVDGTISAGGGMEYPNITVIGNTSEPIMLELVIAHEVGHNWFYGILGSNERVNAWLDEGFNSYHETRYLVEKYGDELRFAEGMLPAKLASRFGADIYDYESIDELAALLSDRLHLSQPMQCHSDEFLSVNYGTIVYKKTAVVLRHLCAYLGKDRFDQTMRTYYDEWKFKHPDPAAVREVFERETGEDLSWFFEDIVQTTGRVNYKLTGVRTKGDSLVVKVANVGEIPAPFLLQGLKDGEIVESKWHPAVTPWDMQRITFGTPDMDEIAIDRNRTMLEYDRRNNQIRTKGLFRRSNPPSLQFITRLEDPQKAQLFWAPVAGWNELNGFMAGLNLHNIPLPMRDWEFSLTPMYSFGSGTAAGFARTSLYRGTMDAHLSSRSFRYREAGTFDQSTSDYLRNALEVNHRFDAVPNSPWSSVLHIDIVHLGLYLRDLDDNDLIVSGTGGLNTHFLLPKVSYTVNKKGAFVNQSWELTGRYVQSTASEQGAYSEVWYRGSYRYNSKGKKLFWRGFAAYTVDLNDTDRGSFPLGAFGLTGRTDVFADHLFLGRSGAGWLLPSGSVSLIDRLITNEQGNMRIPVYANRFMGSFTTEFELPFKFPLSVFAGVMLYEDFTMASNYDYVAGITVPIVRDVLEWHLPLATRSLLGGGEYNPFDLFTFEFHIDRINPKKLIRQIGR